jgi:hypothetical protein
MDYLTKFYKNQSEVLAEQIRFLEQTLESLYENSPPGYSFTAGNQNAPRQSDDDLETRARQIRKTGLFGAKIADENQTQEYRDIQNELARRRGQAPAPAQNRAPAPAQNRAPAPVRRPVDQMGPQGSPSAVATSREVQRAQQVADETGLPTALPTNVTPGTQYITDMDGNPIAVQPSAPRPMSARDFNLQAQANQQAMEVDDGSSDEDYIYSGGYAQSPESWRSRYPLNYPPDVSMGRVQAGDSPEARQDLEDAAMGRGQYKPPQVPLSNRFIQPKPGMNRSMFDTGTRGGYDTPPSPSFVQPSRGTSTTTETEPAPRPGMISRSYEKPAPVTKPRINPPIKPSAVMDEVPAGEDFSSFWNKRLHGGDVKTYMRDIDLMDMMKQNKRSNLFGPAISDDKQTIEYRAAQAELRRRGKLK